jgi:hypothetical protein
MQRKSSPTLSKQAAVVSLFKQGKKSPVNNYRPINILNIFSKIFVFVIHGTFLNTSRQNSIPVSMDLRNINIL